MIGKSRRLQVALFNNAARPARNETAIIEWVIVSEWEQQPALMAWGNRSILFRDPDGNLVNLFTPATEEATMWCDQAGKPHAVLDWR